LRHQGVRTRLDREHRSRCLGQHEPGREDEEQDEPDQMRSHLLFALVCFLYLVDLVHGEFHSSNSLVETERLVDFSRTHWRSICGFGLIVQPKTRQTKQTIFLEEVNHNAQMHSMTLNRISVAWHVAQLLPPIDFEGCLVVRQ